MINLEEKKVFYIRPHDIESYAKEKYNYTPEFHIIDEEEYYYDNVYLFEDINGDIARDSQYLISEVKNGRFVNLPFLLNVIVNEGVLPIGTYLLLT